MPAQIEARRLSGADLGKNVSLEVTGGRYTGPWQLEGELLSVKHWRGGSVTILANEDKRGPREAMVRAGTAITITGKPS